MPHRNGLPLIKSAAIYAPASIPISEAIELLNVNRARCLLITENKSRDSNVIGIFNETDLLRKIALIRGVKQWNRPIATVMCRNLYYLPLDQVANAAEFMVKHDITTVPLVAKGSKLNRSTIVGLVYAFDLIRAQALTRALETDSNFRIFRVGLLTRNTRYKTYLFQSLVGFSTPHITEYRMKDLITNKVVNLPRGMDALIIDMDYYSVEQSAELIRAGINNAEAPIICGLLDSATFDKSSFEALRGLSKETRFAIFEKPVLPFEIFAEINRAQIMESNVKS